MVFEKASYREVLTEVLGASGTRSGLRSALAKALGCQTAYISQVLSGDANLNLEQGLGFCSFANLDPASTDFFLLLLQRDRAGTQELKSYYQNKIDLALSERRKIRSRVQTTKEVSDEDKAKYYSTWLYSACHVALSVKDFSNIAALSDRMKVPRETIAQIIDSLITMGLAKEEENGKLNIGPAHIHLGEDSEHILKHHSNWRVRALRSLEYKSPKDLHYSVAYSLSHADAGRIREKLLTVIKENMEIVKPSPEETVYCQTLDFFEL
jgi:uncharacterized protein (TIGR02147 family)